MVAPSPAGSADFGGDPAGKPEKIRGSATMVPIPTRFTPPVKTLTAAAAALLVEMRVQPPRTFQEWYPCSPKPRRPCRVDAGAATAAPVDGRSLSGVAGGLTGRRVSHYEYP